MQILAALFLDDISIRETPDSLTRLDLTGIQFTTKIADPFPLELAPHLVVLVHSKSEGNGFGVLEVTYHLEGEIVARNAQPLQIEPGLFAYRLVRAELELAEPCTVHAHCRIDNGEPVIVPYTIEASS